MTIETGPPGEGYDDNVEFIIDTLPGFMANSEDSGNWKLVTPIGNQVDELETDLKSIDRAASVKSADTIDQLKKLAKGVGITHDANEGKEHFRSRILARYKLNTAESTLDEILKTVASILNVNVEDVSYNPIDSEGVIGIVVPLSAINSLNLSTEELSNILNDLVPAGYEVAGRTSGTLLYVSESTYTSTDNWSLYDGYDGLDTNDEPKGGGGTYAGIIN